MTASANYNMTVLVTTYNQPFESVRFTLETILAQDFDSFEIVISDDGSSNGITDEIETYLNTRSFHRYSIVSNAENAGTVKNIISGLSAVKGNLVKQLSPGDGLFAPDTLSTIWRFYKQTRCPIGFGQLKGYAISADGSPVFSDYNAPRKPDAFESSTTAELLRDEILNTNWIPGCSLFYEPEFFAGYLKRLAHFGVRYCEDLSCPLVLADDQRIAFLNAPVLWYELGSGISTSGGKKATARMYADHRAFFTALAQSDPSSHLYRSALKRFSFREFIALKTPFYRLAQSIVKTSYSSSQTVVSEESRQFFSRCRDMGSC